ncbi:unnamed protein product [Fusarium graminearum]|nr:unnamed protein product [Fusarium graminearum]CAG2010640.1 unnamed protein product [Fusarium graminearum]
MPYPLSGRNHPARRHVDLPCCQPRSVAILGQVCQRPGTYRADYMAYRSGANASSLNMHLSDFTAC